MYAIRSYYVQVIKNEIDRQTPVAVQAYALTWTVPYRVGCMSITTAFAAGFDADFCALGCKPTRSSPYFNSRSRRPHTDFGWRPTMMLAGMRVRDVETLIDRGISADGSNPPGTAYLLSTDDRQSVITSYSIHYTKLYDPQPGSRYRQSQSRGTD